MQKPQYFDVKTALKISFEYWILGVVIFNLILYFKIAISEIALLALILNSFPVILFARRYLKTINSKKAIDGLMFGIFLAATQIFADALYILLFLKETSIIFNSYLFSMAYLEMIIFPAIYGYLYKSY